MKYFKLILTNNFISRWNKFLRFKSINFGTRFKKRVRFPTILQVFLISQRITRNRIVFSREFIKKQIIYQEKTRKSPRINDHFQGHARPSIFHPPSWIKIPKFRSNRARISAGISQWGRQRERKSGHRVARLSSRGGRVIDSNPPSKLSSRPLSYSSSPLAMLLASNQRQSDSQTLSIADRTKTLADHCPLKWIPSRNSRFPLEPTECPLPPSSCSARYHLSSSLIGTINVGEVVLSIGANDCCAARFWRMKIFENGCVGKV